MRFEPLMEKTIARSSSYLDYEGDRAAADELMPNRFHRGGAQPERQVLSRAEPLAYVTA